MRLLNVKTKRLEIHTAGSHRYAIVSHRWGIDTQEVLFMDIRDPLLAARNEGYGKILGSCNQALQDGLEYVWLDTCCIDRSNNTKLTEAINSMYTWYQDSEVCYVYLCDVTDISEFCESEWFKRGWTLQELIAPKLLKFFNKHWVFLGTLEDLVGEIAVCTGIPAGILLSGDIPEDVSIAQRIFWASKRETTRVEDRAYSLLGLLGVNLPAIYGIEHGAFVDLQQKIISVSQDQSLFAWQSVVNDDGSFPSNDTGLLSPSPAPYQIAYQIPIKDFYTPFGRKRSSRWPYFSFKNGAVRINLPIRPVESPDGAGDSDVYEALLRCSRDSATGSSHQGQQPLVVYLRYNQENDQYVRVHTPTSLRSLDGDSVTSFKLEKVHVHEVPRSALRNPLSLARTPEVVPTPTPLSALPEKVPVKSHTNETLAHSIPQSRALLHIDVHTSSSANGVHDFGRQSAPTPSAMTEVTSSINSTTPPTSLSSFEDLSVSPTPPHFLLQHPPGTETTNIVICGEPGAGAGGVVNLLIGKDVVYTHSSGIHLHAHVVYHL